jgi:hypothetical protein
MKRIIFIVLAISVCLASCSSSTTVTGEVFVVTAGAGNYKLGLVHIEAVPEKDMLEFFANLPKVDHSADADRLKAAQAELDEAKQQVLLADQKAMKQQAAGNLDKLDDYRLALDEAERAKYAVYQAERRVSEADRAMTEVLGPESYFGLIPPGVASSTTDSDGKYKLIIPRKGRYMIVARASRRAGGSDENYYWANWINADGQPQSLTLSNNNEAGPIDSIKK